MTPKEKAFQLFCKFYRDSDLLLEYLSRIQAKECALIAVDEIIEAMQFNSWQNRNEIEYYKEVKKEIEKEQ